MKQSGQSGFTIVELIVVIIIIGLLATITSMMYSSSQQQASDTRIRDAADKFSDAIQLWSAQNNNAQPKGGWASATPASALNNGCIDGGQGFADYQYGTRDGNYQCTVGDAMVATGYLTADLFNSLPASSVYNVTKMIFMIYPCANNAKQWNLMFNLQSPTTSDTANINSVLTTCGTNPVTSPYITTYGMRGAIAIKFP